MLSNYRKFDADLIEVDSVLIELDTDLIANSSKYKI